MKSTKNKIIAFIAAAVLMILTTGQVSAQKYVTKNGYIKFYSETPIETIQHIIIKHTFGFLFGIKSGS